MSQKKRHSQVVFKPYVQNQGWLFPPSLEELIPQTHRVRLISRAIDGMDIDPIISTYKGGGSGAYHPKMLLKVLIYAYVEKIYSSRMIEKALQENICFMWLSGMQHPDHNSINNFRRHRLDGTVKDVFKQVLLLLVEQDYVDLSDYHLDGTKMESVANRYTFVWAKNVERYKAGVLAKINAVVEQIEQFNEQSESEAEAKSNQEPESVLAEGQEKISDAQALTQTIERINQTLSASVEEDKSIKKKRRLLAKLEKQYLEKLEKYEEQERLLAGRNSYSKTDVDATFMRSKDDHMQNGQLKPNYNIQLGTQHQFILNYTIHQTASDQITFHSHMSNTLEMCEELGLDKPKNGIADAGYGSQQNYELLQQQGIEAYIKYPGYYKEQQGNKFKYPFDQRTLYYNEQGDYFICPMGQKMSKFKQTTQRSTQGEKQQLDHYQAINCTNCPLRTRCFKAKGNRIIKVNHKAWQYRKQAKKRLQSLKGFRKTRQRNIDVEAVFGHMKQNRGFRRFYLRGLDGVNIELGLLALANNFIKWFNLKQAKLTTMPAPQQPPAQIAQLAQNPKPFDQLYRA